MAATLTFEVFSPLTNSRVAPAPSNASVGSARVLPTSCVDL